MEIWQVDPQMAKLKFGVYKIQLAKNVTVSLDVTLKQKSALVLSDCLVKLTYA